jgi:hypothetical protein
MLLQDEKGSHRWMEFGFESSSFYLKNGWLWKRRRNVQVYEIEPRRLNHPLFQVDRPGFLDIRESLLPQVVLWQTE